MSRQIPTLHTEITGTGPVVVLLHGFMASTRYWDKVTAILAKDHTVVAMDLLGFGNSPKPGCSRYDYNAQMRSIEATLEAHNVTRPFSLIGHSMGALVALRYASENPNRVSQVLLANMPLLFTKRQARRNVLGTNLLYRLALRPGLHALIWPVFKLTVKLLSVRSAEGVLARRSYMFQSTGISRLRSLRNVIYAARIETDLRKLSIQTTILSGLQDRRAMYAGTLGELRLAAHITVRNIDGDHHFPLRAPQLFRELLLT